MEYRRSKTKGATYFFTVGKMEMVGWVKRSATQQNKSMCLIMIDYVGFPLSTQPTKAMRSPCEAIRPYLF